jgi:bacteriorhodopsin
MAALLEDRSNWALGVNPPQAARHLTTNGSNWLWAVFAIFLLSFLIHAALSLKPHHHERVFSHLFTLALLAGTLAYFAQASDLGSRAVRTSSGRRFRYPSYQIFWPKYAFWAVAFPAITIALGLLSGMSWATILYAVGLAWIWVFSYFISAMTATTYKWGFYAIGTLAWLGLAALTLGAQKRATAAGVGRHYSALAGWTNLLWLLYPIAFGVSDGGNVIGVTASFVFWGILDILLLPVIAAAFYILSRKWDYRSLGLEFTQHGRTHGHAGPGMVEKDLGHRNGAGAPPHTAGGAAMPGTAIPPAGHAGSAAPGAAPVGTTAV